MKKRITISAIVILLAALFVAGCAGTRGTGDTQLLSGLNNRVIETVLENDESGGSIAAFDVVIDQAIYGSFSEPET